MSTKAPKTKGYVPRPRRQPLVCIPCAKRKIGCDKRIPCSNCVKRNRVSDCRRSPEKSELFTRDTTPDSVAGDSSKVLIPRSLDVNDIVQETPSSTHNLKIDQEFTKDVYESIRLNDFINESSLEDYIHSVQSLTFGLTKFEGMAPSFSSKDLPYEQILEKILNLLNYNVSYRICLLSCQYTIILHQSLVLSLFMQDHDRYWNVHVQEDPRCLFHLTSNKFKASSPTDYYYWIALYYMVLCTGIYFAKDELRNLLPFDEETLTEAPKVFFLSALDCIYRARALEIPDVRFLQVYGLMAICSHAFGNVHLNGQLLRIAIGTAQSLQLHNIEDNEPHIISYQKEMSKRIWYNLYIIDALSNKDSLIKSAVTPLPQLVTNAELFGNISPKTHENQLPDDEYIGLLYQRIMAKMGQIKQESKQKNVKLSNIILSWIEMNQLRDNIEKYFNNSLITSPNQRYGTGNYGKYLVFSSLTRESLDLGCRLLSYVGRQSWHDNFRDKCMKLASDILTHNASPNLPAYYQKHWIVVQHLIYACMFTLLNMLMFKEKDDTQIKPSQLKIDSLRRVELAMNVISKFRESHFTAKIGLAVIEKLYYLVSTINVKSVNDKAVADISLKEFLNDLKISSHLKQKMKQGRGVIPPINESQYLRFGQLDSNKPSPENLPLNQSDLEKYATKEFLDPDLDKVLDDTGWYEFMDFFFGNKVE